MRERDLVSIATFRSAADAQLAKGVLDEVGIESVIRSNDVGGMYPGIGGAELLVRAVDVQNAIDAIGRAREVG
jgi:hypothetical protein